MVTEFKKKNNFEAQRHVQLPPRVNQELKVKKKKKSKVYEVKAYKTSCLVSFYNN